MKILIANRGEIALRVMRTARRLGHSTVAIYSEADARAPHVSAADEAVCVGPAASSQSYLAIDKVIAAAKATGATAVHPGYGFLAENAAFARACAEAKVTFIGPPAEAIELMGDKRAAKQAMKKAGVPCVPGYDDEAQDDTTLTTEAEKIGFPVMVKAAAGGGGRGMRRVDASDGLAEALRSARSEAEGAFGDGTLLLEKAIDGARHVELQVLADEHGNAIHLGERDCSVQRRHQKVFEECPSPAVNEELRARMGAAAVEATKACNYVGAGTVEFLLDAQGEFYFLEMNTRLQVEHPVTEAVVGVDLVEEQIRVAEGEKLSLTQDDVALDGHAIEARLYAEDAERGFLPQTGTLLRWQPPESIRVDAGVVEGSRISPHYDPMIAKLIAYGATRGEALRKLDAALGRTIALGVVTNKRYLRAVCQHPMFASGEATTSFSCDVQVETSTRAIATAALVVTLEGARGLAEDSTLIGWRSGGPVWWAVHLSRGEDSFETKVHFLAPRRFAVEWGEERVDLTLVSHDDGEVSFLHDDVRRTVAYVADGDRIWVDDGGGAVDLTNTTHQAAETEDAAGSGRLSAPLDGAVTEVAAAVGDVLEKGQLVLVLEAMKMEHRIVADVDGKLEELLVSKGQQVKTRQLLAQITPD